MAKKTILKYKFGQSLWIGKIIFITLFQQLSMFKNSKFRIILLVILIGGLIFSSYFIWQNNSKITQDSQIQPLVADENYHVVVMEECDLAFRIKKKFKHYETTAEVISLQLSKKNPTNIPGNPFSNYLTYDLKVKIQQPEDFTHSKYLEPNFYVVCDDSSKISDFDFWLKDTHDLWSDGTSRPDTRKYLHKNRYLQQIFSLNFLPLVSNYMETDHSSMFFQTPKKYYSIGGDILGSTRLNDDSAIQNLQLNSFAPSTPSVKL